MEDNISFSFAPNDPDMISKLTFLINEAYDVTELGNTGTKFKNAQRIMTMEDYENAFEDGRVIIATDKDGEILGTIVFSFEISPFDGKKVCHFGPFATNIHKQRKGLGARLIGFLEAHAKKNECDCFEITVVNHRTDVMPYYKRMGFVMTDRVLTFPHPERLTRESIFHLLRKDI
jgi:predicted N-acetyltransferase YhbS